MDALSIVISLFVLLFAITIHEASHAWAAYKMGDPTADGHGTGLAQSHRPYRPDRDGPPAPCSSSSSAPPPSAGPSR